MKAEHPWSESGRELLFRISVLVLKNGGNFRCALAIEKEWMNDYQLERAAKRFIGDKHAWSRTEIDFLKANLHLPYDDIAFQMKDRTPDAVRQKIYNMQKANQIGGKIEARKKHYGY